MRLSTYWLHNSLSLIEKEELDSSILFSYDTTIDNLFLMTSSLENYFSPDIVTKRDHFFSKSFFRRKHHGESASIENVGRRRRGDENIFKNKGRGISIRRGDM